VHRETGTVSQLVGPEILSQQLSYMVCVTLCRNIVEILFMGFIQCGCRQVNIMDLLEDSGDVPGNTNTTAASKVYIYNLPFNRDRTRLKERPCTT